MKTISQLLDELIQREGGYVNHPNDRGGPTNWGITEQVARAYGYQSDMKLLPREKAREIYGTQYWINPGFNEIAKRSPRIAEELFDTGVNMGPKRASEYLQRALNALNRGAVDYPDIGVDGDIGRMTLYALDRYFEKRGKGEGELVMLRAIEALQGAHYMNLSEKDKKQESFTYGWFAHRVGNVK